MPKLYVSQLRLPPVQVNLCGTKLGDEGWCAIFDALRDNPQNKIAKWDLSGPNYTGEGINRTILKSLAAYMALSASLTEVRSGCTCLWWCRL